MPHSVWFAIASAVFTLAAAGFAIYYWGPRSERRPVICPEKKQLARIGVARREGTFGALLNWDVASCSLLEGPVHCSKACMH